MNGLCEQFDLLTAHEDVVRIPFLVKGKLVSPPPIKPHIVKDTFEKANGDTSYVKLPDCQLLRFPLVDRRGTKNAGGFFYQVMPAIRASDIIEAQDEEMWSDLYSLSTEDVLAWLHLMLDILRRNDALVARGMRMYRLISGLPDAFLEALPGEFESLFGISAAGRMIDNELCCWGIAGRRFLDGWVEVPAETIPGTAWSILESSADKIEFPVAGNFIRAVPTRQLHITAGNAAEVPLVSALRAVLTKSPAAIKIPSAGTTTGALFSLAAASAMPEHPLTRHLSLVYWQGGDRTVEDFLFMPGAFDRIVVWGSPQTVSSVQSRSMNTKVISLNPRYGVSLVGREAFSGSLDAVVTAACVDSVVYDQQSCSASLVHYVECSESDAEAYALLLKQELAMWDRIAPHFLPPESSHKINNLMRGRYNSAPWFINRRDGEFVSGAVVVPGEFDILDHPMNRLVVVRPVDSLAEAVKYLQPGVSSTGIYPEERRLAMRDSVAAHGVSSVLPLGRAGLVFPGMPHDGMMVLSQLVEWKNG
jgi:hypothetical protein